MVGTRLNVDRDEDDLDLDADRTAVTRVMEDAIVERCTQKWQRKMRSKKQVVVNETIDCMRSKTGGHNLLRSRHRTQTLQVNDSSFGSYLDTEL